jgi:hypothetical protein
MRGTPWLRFALMAIALALAGVPILFLTRSEEAPSPAVPVRSPASVERELTLEIHTAPAAQSIGASYLDRELIPNAHEGGSYSGTIRLPAKSAADLVVTARWRGTQAAALRVRTSNEDGPVAEASFWGTDKIEEVLTIPAAQQ